MKKMLSNGLIALTLLAAPVLVAASALAHDVKELPPGTIKISGVIPGMGEHYANPKNLPLGPIYGVSGGKVIFSEFMMTQKEFADGKSWSNMEVAKGIGSVDHVDIHFEAHGHEGFKVPHYDIHMYTVPHAAHMKIKAPH